MSKPALGQDADDFPAPEWLRDALKDANVSPAFVARCYEAADVAYDIARLRRQAEQSPGLVGLPFKAYLTKLAEPLGISLGRTAQWLNIDDLGRLDPLAIVPLSRLARGLGLQRLQFAMLMRAGFAINEGHAPLELVPHRRHAGRTASTPLEECGHTLDDIEKSYPPDVRGRLMAMLDEIARQFDATE